MRKSSSTKTPSHRSLKVGEELRHILAESMHQMGFLDPQLEKVSISVTEVRIGADLKNATAYIMTLGGKNLAPTIKALNKHVKHFRHEVARNTNLRYTPALKFEADTTFDYAQKINELLKK